MNFATVYFSHIGLMVIILATITRFVPRFASPFIVASIAVILGIIIWAILFLGVSAMNLYDTQNQFFFILFSVLGLVSFVLVWLQVRFKLNRAWFCFEDS